MSTTAEKNKIRRQNGEIIIQIICSLEKPNLQNIVDKICGDMDIEDVLTVQNTVARFLYKSYNLGFLIYDDEHNFHINPVIAKSLKKPKVMTLNEYLEETSGQKERKSTKIPTLRRSVRLKAKKDAKAGKKSHQ